MASSIPSERLAGRVALVTGGARGQGLAHAAALAAEGAAVAIVDAPEAYKTVPYAVADRERLDAAVAELGGAGTKAVGIVADVRSRTAVAAAVAETEAALGPVDILVANAGVCAPAAIGEIDEAAWSETVDTNLAGVLWSIQAVIPGMRERGFGRIVATSSMAGRGGMANLAHYSAAKWGVIGLVKCAALELAGSGVTVNAICPTTVGTEMVTHRANYQLFVPDRDDPTIDDARERFGRMNPLGVPWLEPEDVAREVVHLACDRGITTGTVVELGLGQSSTHP